MKRVTQICAVGMFALSVGCSGPTEPQVSTETLLQRVMEEEANPVSPSAVAEMLALGAKSTDVQRDLLLKDLIGSVVEWKVEVYEISLAEGNYRVISEPFPIIDTDAINVLRAIITVTPRSDQDHAVLQAAKTGDSLTIKGVVQDVVLRGAITISPAILVEGKHSAPNSGLSGPSSTVDPV